MSPLPRSLAARFKPGENIPVYASFAGGAITAGRFVRITGKNAAGAYDARHCTAGQKASGVAERSVPAPASGAKPNNNNGTNIGRPGQIAYVEAGAAVAALANVSSDGTGRAITAVSTHTINGQAITAAAQAGDIIEVDLGFGGVVA